MIELRTTPHRGRVIKIYIFIFGTPYKNKLWEWIKTEMETHIHNIEMKMLLNAILKDFDSFKAEIEKQKKRRNEFDFDFDDVFPMPPTECMNTPIIIIPS